MYWICRNLQLGYEVFPDFDQDGLSAKSAQALRLAAFHCLAKFLPI
jgi:hypothetical protein